MGVAPAPSYTFCVFCTPVGPYFKGGLSCINLMISEEFHRAAPGGSGGVKAIGNYAPGMMPSKNVKKKGGGCCGKKQKNSKNGYKTNPMQELREKKRIARIEAED